MSTRTAQIGVKSRIHFALEVRTSCRKSVVARLCLVVLTMRVRVREHAYWYHGFTMLHGLFTDLSPERSTSRTLIVFAYIRNTTLALKRFTTLNRTTVFHWTVVAGGYLIESDHRSSPNSAVIGGLVGFSLTDRDEDWLWHRQSPPSLTDRVSLLMASVIVNKLIIIL